MAQTYPHRNSEPGRIRAGRNDAERRYEPGRLGLRRQPQSPRQRQPVEARKEDTPEATQSGKCKMKNRISTIPNSVPVLCVPSVLCVKGVSAEVAKEKGANERAPKELYVET